MFSFFSFVFKLFSMHFVFFIGIFLKILFFFYIFFLFFIFVFILKKYFVFYCKTKFESTGNRVAMHFSVSLLKFPPIVGG